MDLSQVAQWIKDGGVASVWVETKDVTVELKDITVVTTRKGPDASFVEMMLGLGVPPEKLTEPNLKLSVKPPEELSSWLAFLGGLLPLIFIGALFFFLLRQAQGSNSQAMSFGKSKARMFTRDKPTVTFQDVAGA